MKKILSIIAIVLCIFQLVVFADVITIGQEAKNRDSSSDASNTWINEGVATGTGKITTVYAWTWGVDVENAVVAIFEEVSPNHFTTRDSEAIGTIVVGAKRTFSVDLDVEAGDRIGINATVGLIRRSTSGYLGLWYHSGDQIPCTNVDFGAIVAGDAISLEGVGDTVAVGIEWNGVTITKWNGIAITIPLNTQ